MMPKRFREYLSVLGDDAVWITNAMDGVDHLDVLPDSAFQTLCDQVSRLTNDKKVLAYKRYYFGSAIRVELDAAGRLLVPAALRQRIQLRDKIAFVGLDRGKFELWAPELLNKQEAETSLNADDILAHVAALGVG